MKQKTFLLALILFLSPFKLTAQPVNITTVAVLDLEITGGVPDSYQRPLSDRLRKELIKTGRFSVVERNNMENILEEQGLQLSDCTSDECAIEVGKLLGVERMIAGSLAKVGQTHTINLRMVSVETGKIIKAESVDCQCSIDIVLTSSMQQIAEMMAGIKRISRDKIDIEYGSLCIKSSIINGIVKINDQTNETSFPALFDSLVAGDYRIEVIAPDHDSFVDSVSIQPDKKTTITADLRRRQGFIGVSELPDETNVIVDGKKFTKTPAGDKEMDIGRHTVQLLHKNYNDGSVKIIDVVHNQTTRLLFDLELKPVYRPILSYALWPGMGQLKDDRHILGTIYVSGEVSALGFLAYSIFDYNESIRKYKTTIDEYAKAVAEQDIRRTYQARLDANQKIDDSETMVLIASSTAAGIYLINIIDALIFRNEINPSKGSNADGDNNVSNGSDSSQQASFSIKFLRDSSQQVAPGINIGFKFDLCGRSDL
ncbi:CsgG/HfaB family protein [Calditrichota bacterium]